MLRVLKDYVPKHHVSCQGITIRLVHLVQATPDAIEMTGPEKLRPIGEAEFAAAVAAEAAGSGGMPFPLLRTISPMAAEPFGCAAFRRKLDGTEAGEARDKDDGREVATDSSLERS